ncbi:helix-turn-helix transcriptional regulator [Microlunatus soli]|uniref:Helix-turn-helix domain-containing protein n=1 Tax=Microlunatus soli TaxID=630515 RepID=A0A1H1ZSV6_9ACTN|nr:helix-turn-helix transcriptional regulator [Microlunatus soli]SDT36667.1 Helix-turn-helix domain-containing protein [Microlunatus soli]
MTTTARSELSDFLRARRSQVSPADVGLPVGARRRLQGLRREEVAVLAGVGSSWYQWLEQGRDITVSGQVLDAVARVLRLSDEERRHLYVLAGLNPPLPQAPSDCTVGADIVRLLAGWLPHPAHVVDRYWNFVEANDAARVIFGWRKEFAGNCLIDFFGSGLYRGGIVAWDEMAPIVVANYRYEMTRHGNDDGYRAVIDQAVATSGEFADLWGRHEVLPAAPTIKTFNHPEVGELVMEGRMLHLPERSDLTLVLHMPQPGTATAERIAELISTERRLRLATSA